MHRAVRGWNGPGFQGFLNAPLAVAHALSGGKALDVIRGADPEVPVREARQGPGEGGPTALRRPGRGRAVVVPLLRVVRHQAADLRNDLPFEVAGGTSEMSPGGSLRSRCADLTTI